MDSVWFNFVADLKKVVELNPKKSILDKMFKLETYSLEVKMVGCKRKKFTIHFIEEDVNKLKEELEIIIEENKQAITIEENKQAISIEDKQ